MLTGMSNPPGVAVVPAADQRVAAPRRRGFTIVPFFGDLVAMGRLLRDRGASRWLKLLVVLTIAYVVWPLDLLPDFAAPLVAWIDDVGVVLAIRLILSRQLERYRYPLFERSPPREPALGLDAGGPGA